MYDDISFFHNLPFVIIVLDKLQFLTVSGFYYASSLASFNKKTVQTITAADVPSDFLALFNFQDMNDANLELISVNQMNSFTSEEQQHKSNCYPTADYESDSDSNSDSDSFFNETDVGHIYPNNASVDEVVKLLVTHITQIQALRNQGSIEILIIGCEDPFFVFELYVRLCFHLQYCVRSVCITVIDKDEEVINRWHLLAEKMLRIFPQLRHHVKFQLLNFMVYENTIMSVFDIVFTLIVGKLTASFSLKFALLAVQQNERPYYRNSKLFLAPRNLFVKARRLATGCDLRFTSKVQMTYLCRNRTNEDRDLCCLTCVKPENDSNFMIRYHFAYHSKVDENPADRYIQSPLHLAFHEAVYDEILKATSECFDGMFGKDNAKCFSDVVHTGSNLALYNDRHSVEVVSIHLENVDICISVSFIDGLLQVPSFDISYESTNSKGTYTQQNFVSISLRPAKEYYTAYKMINISNALFCLASMQCAIFQYMKLTLKAVDIDFNVDEFKYLDISRRVLKNFKKSQFKILQVSQIIKDLMAKNPSKKFHFSNSSTWTFDWINQKPAVMIKSNPRAVDIKGKGRASKLSVLLAPVIENSVDTGEFDDLDLTTDRESYLSESQLQTEFASEYLM